MEKNKQEYWRWTESNWRNPDINPGDVELFTVGIDVGSVSSQAVIAADGEVYAYGSMRTGSDSPTSAVNALNYAIEAAGIDKDKIQTKEDLISWYVPCRNALFLLIGLAFAESKFISKTEKYNIYLGIKYEGDLQFKDTTPEFLEQMNKTSGFCTQEEGFKFIAPFLNKDKEELIELAKKLNINLKDTYSCYIGGEFHCGVCSACKSRKKAFKFSNTEDPTQYKN